MTVLNDLNLVKKDKKYIWHPFTQMKDWLEEDPLVIKSGDGVYLEDIEGNRYIDGVSSLWVNVHGHNNSYLNKAIKEQLQLVAHSTFLGLTHPKAIELSEKLINVAPKGLTKVFYSDSGAEAVEIALKMAFQYWHNKGNDKKNKFVYLSNSYHGDTLGAVSVGGIDMFHSLYRPLLFNSIKVSNYDYEKLNEIFKQKHEQIAAFILEPLIQAAAGMLTAPEGYLRQVRKLCDKYDILLIADEVATGFGKTGKMFACEHENITPDIMCLGKGITGGYLPLAANLIKEKVYEAFLAPYKDKKTLFHGHTYTANPLCCAVAVANLELFKNNRTIERLQPKIELMKKEFENYFKLKHVGDIRQCGIMAGIEIMKDKKNKVPYSWDEKKGIQVIMEARKRGVIIRPLGNVIVVMPPLSISKEELKKLLTVVYESIKQVTEI